MQLVERRTGLTAGRTAPPPSPAECGHHVNSRYLCAATLGRTYVDYLGRCVRVEVMVLSQDSESTQPSMLNTMQADLDNGSVRAPVCYVSTFL